MAPLVDEERPSLRAGAAAQATAAAWVHAFDGRGSLRPCVTRTFAGGVTGALAGLIIDGGGGTGFGGWRERSGLEASSGFAF